MRRESIFEDLMKMPWPVGVGFAAIIFFVFHVYQLVVPADQASQIVFSIVRWVAYFFIFMCLFAAFLSFLTQKIRSRRFRATRSISDMRSLSWRQFESFVGEVFREQGYFVIETSEGPDNGVDLVLKRDSEKTYVQCKHWKTNTVGVAKIRELLGSMAAGGAQSGIFVASGNYSKAAQELARDSGIHLVDGDELARLIADLDENRSDLTGEAVNVPTVACPKCDAPMVKRVATRGANVGKEFWGCSTFPACRGTRET